ncbi:MAG: HAMP domain-containing sensor histidine kinase [Verrucomicrobiales bacterium]
MAASARQPPEPSPEPAAANPYSYKKMQSDGLAQVAQRRMQIDRATEEVRELADQEAEALLQEDASPAREPAEPEGEIRLRSAGEAKKITQAEVPPGKAQAMGRSSGSNGSNGGAAQAAESEPPPTRQLRRTRPAFTPSPGQPESKIASTRAAFLDAVGDNEEGAVARFINGEMQVLFWYRPPAFPDYVFGVELDLEFLAGILADVVKAASEDGSEVCLALLDERGTPVATSVAGFDADWSRPFVAAEIGGALPHWEIAAYLTDPRALGKAASAARIALWLMVLLLIAAIGVGGGLIFFDLRKELALARQKTDFVSNVSHELKTPLTSITMFSDLLCNGAPEPDAQRRYAQVIQSEAGRLARLINNVLDFSRMERGDKRYQFSEIDLGGFLDELLGHYRPHLEAGGYRLRFHNALPAGAAIRADRDALSQVIVNLISNAEKYGGEAKVIDVELGEGAGGAAEIRVCDRGDGVPSGTEEKIFEKFFRAHDSLDSGIQGSGLGLTLARQIALFHGGAIRYGRREGGGSVFTLALPLSGSSPDRAAKAENAPGDPLSRTPPTP